MGVSHTSYFYSLIWPLEYNLCNIFLFKVLLIRVNGEAYDACAAKMLVNFWYPICLAYICNKEMSDIIWLEQWITS